MSGHRPFAALRLRSQLERATGETVTVSKKDLQTVLDAMGRPIRPHSSGISAAQGIEARRAIDGEAGVVACDESAARSATPKKGT